MKKNSELLDEAEPGSDLLFPPSIEVIEQWLTRDLTVVNTLIHALLTDKELRTHIATFMHGRYSNHINKPDPAQMGIPFPPVPKPRS